jgi:hypothetical protein
MWGVYDVGRALGEDSATALFKELGHSLEANIDRWDTGYWSRYCLFPGHRIEMLASSFYHGLHISQLTATERLFPSEVLTSTRIRWQGYAQKRVNRWRVIAKKGAFRITIPRNKSLAPWLSIGLDKAARDGMRAKNAR